MTSSPPINKPFFCAPKGFKVVETDDGSFTFYSEQYGENCHSTAGALGETKRYFLEETKLREFTQANAEVSIFEVGWGLGLNFIETLKICKDIQLNYISTEIDENLIIWAQQNYPELAGLKKINTYQYLLETQGLKLKIYLGNAAKMNYSFNQNFDFIFQDAFSPKKCPELWTHQWFEFLYKITKKGGVLVTYSASHSVLRNLNDSNWQTLKIKGFGHKRSATKAIKK